MFGLVYVMVLAAGTAAAGSPCPEEEFSEDGHLESVCSAFLEGKSAYSATFRASLIPRPASQQVMIYRLDETWFVRTAGYRWKHGAEIVTRRREMAISDADAQAIVDLVTITSLERLARLPYYGSPDVICMDGAVRELAMAMAGRKYVAGQHSCSDPTELNEIADGFRRIALKYDPAFEGLLTGLGK